MGTQAIDDADILDQTIRDLRDALSKQKDFALRLKLTDRLLKALSLKAKVKQRRRGKGFNLENGQ